MAGNRVERVAGILNGTCNFILSTMRETGREFADVLAEAQKRIRITLANKIGDQSVVLQPVCVMDHDCQADPKDCVFELQESGKVH